MIDESVLKETLTAALRAGGEFAEVFVEDVKTSGALLDDGRVEDVSSGRDRGAGIRVLAGETVGFAHTSDLTENGLRIAAEAAGAAARSGGGEVRVADLTRRDVPSAPVPQILPENVDKTSKVELLQRADVSARASDPSIRQVTARYSDKRRRFLVANSDGLLSGDDQVRTAFSVQTVGEADTGLQTGGRSYARTMGFEMFDAIDVEDAARDAARMAVTKLDARPAPSGELPVVIAAGGGGVLFHEACGHGLEADLVKKESSRFAGLIGQDVASSIVTIVDDGTLGHEWGNFAIDDEGNPAGRNVLIEDGVLTDYMWDWLRSRREGRDPSGNGRRQSYQHLPMVRMTNTFLMGGATEPDDIIANTEYGVYVAELGGGQVNTASGDFVFGTREAYLIENGRITAPIRDTNLIGNGLDVLKDIDLVGNDFAMGKNGGMCGKDGQSVPVGVGQPTLRVARMTVGGTAA